jgi:hypothetical protein
MSDNQSSDGPGNEGVRRPKKPNHPSAADRREQKSQENKRAWAEKREEERPGGQAKKSYSSGKKRAPNRSPEEVLASKCEKLFQALRRGRDLIRAARFACLPLAKVTKMLDEDEEFASNVDASVDFFEQKHLDHIDRQAPDDWRASSWILERRFRHWAAPETQAKSSQTGVTSKEIRKAILDGLSELGPKHKGMTRKEFDEKNGGSPESEGEE